MKAKSYPDCGYLGSDAAELMAFRANLELVRALERAGHESYCAKLIACTDSACLCRLEKGTSR